MLEKYDKTVARSDLIMADPWLLPALGTMLASASFLAFSSSDNIQGILLATLFLSAPVVVVRWVNLEKVYRFGEIIPAQILDVTKPIKKFRIRYSYQIQDSYHDDTRSVLIFYPNKQLWVMVDPFQPSRNYLLPQK